MPPACPVDRYVRHVLREGIMWFGGRAVSCGLTANIGRISAGPNDWVYQERPDWAGSRITTKSRKYKGEAREYISSFATRSVETCQRRRLGGCWCSSHVAGS